MSYQVLAMLEKNKKALELFRDGYTTKEVAARIGMNIRTLEKRVSNMMEATGVGTKTGLVCLAMKHQIIDV